MNFRNLAMWAVIVILTIGLYNMFKSPQGSVNQKNNIIFSEFLTQVDNGRVVQVEIQGKNIKGVMSNGEMFNTYARGTKVDNLLKFLRSTNNYSKKTLSGCIIQKFKNSVIISSENR